MQRPEVGKSGSPEAKINPGKAFKSKKSSFGLSDYNLLSINLMAFRLASLNCIFCISSAVTYLI
jgi:hypothetical protein